MPRTCTRGLLPLGEVRVAVAFVLASASSTSHRPIHAARMSEVEKLKQARREQNAAKRAAGETVSTDAPAEGAEETNPVPVAEKPKGPLGQIEAAEDKAAKLMDEIVAVAGLVAAASDSEGLDAAAKRQAAASATLGQLTSMMDEIDIGEIEDDEARTAARGRRKAINKRCALASTGDVEVDGDIAKANADLKKAVVAARKTVA